MKYTLMYVIILIHFFTFFFIVTEYINRQAEMILKVIPNQVQEASRIIHQAQEERIYNTEIKNYLIDLYRQSSSKVQIEGESGQ